MSAATPLAPPAPIRVRNPRTGEFDYEFTPPSAAALGEIAGRLRAAQPAWRDAGIEHRIEVLSRWKAALERHKADIVGALATDTARRLIAFGEFGSTLGAIDRWCREAPQLLREPEGTSGAVPSIRWRNQYVPYPLVGVISPWNFPLVLSFIDAIPALLAGCAVLVKPSEVTPRFVTPLKRAIEEVPELARVLAVEPGAGETGAALIPLVDVVCFTGSVKTGRIVAEACARAFIPAFLELGGKDPVIVTASADVERAAETVLRASVLATGQACQSLERVYVHESIYTDFVARLSEKARAVGITWPDANRGEIGPFIWGRQAEVVQAQIADAVAKGARVLAGGEVEDHGGKWLRPTVLVDVTHEMDVMTEETFGPVMPVMKYRDVDEAVRLANFGVYGLSAAVIAGSLEEGEAIARRLDAGGVSLNDGALTGVMHECEKHSFKLSGMGGSRMGSAGLTRFLRRKALLMQTGAPAAIRQFDEALLN
ncbi:MAG: aldehyde dehydrogenase family protein [Steroidobacteraceae bacterium]|jgi:acyl-CoA reductase-like NAD-dependent aldehyde dehydrogenase|nr:aldehyde dehydrogenase family protein [Steroidobacteraceae bacterium]